jgi:hypothetical protein
MFRKCIILGLCMTVSASFAQQADKVELGRLQNGATVSFVRSAGDGWGIDISGGNTLRFMQPKPAKLEIFNTESDIRQLASGYKSVEKTSTGLNALAEIAYGDNVTFRVRDNWSLSGAVVSVNRKVEVTGNAPGGFYSSVVLTVDPSVSWSDVNCLAPCLLYGDPTYDGAGSLGGTQNYNAKCFLMREDVLSAPLFALSFKNGDSVAVLDPSPRGDTTVEETPQRTVMADARFQFGAIGAWQTNDSPIEFGFLFPGTTKSAGGGFGLGRGRGTQPATLRWTRRYHPITQGVEHSYKVSFRFGQKESFRDLTRNAWRWTWNTLNPPIIYIDVEQMRKVLIDHIASQATTIDGRTSIPFAVSTVIDRREWNHTMVAMGFVGKNIECADQLLRESDRDNSERGQKMRQIGLDIISSLIQALSDIPLIGTGYDLSTGKRWTGDHQEWVAPWLRNATEDMRVLMRTYRREKTHGREHPEWLKWVKTYVDWLILQQRGDGSFPRRWQPGSSEVAETTGTASYCPVPLLVIMSEEMNDVKYKQAAIRAAEYVWTNFGERGLFVGGTIDNPNITDKEAGMLSMEAFLSLYDSTKESKWLERAQAAANFAETWIWIWQVPMPQDANDAQLHWKKGVPALGFQGITAAVVGGVDEYLDWAVPSYAKLYKLTKDQHYLDVARVLLHDTKQMVALPGRQYDYKGIGWQQEGWNMSSGSRRGIGGHRFWLPWVSANHLYGITGLEEYDPALYKMLSTKPSSPETK